MHRITYPTLALANCQLALLAALLITPPAPAELKIAGDLNVLPNKMVRLSAEGLNAGAACIWDISDEDKADPEDLGSRFLFTGPPGVYKIKLRAILLTKDGKTQIETARATVTIGKPGPGPTPPGPTPPDPPAPNGGPAPIPGPGFRVLIVFESASLPKMPAQQLNILYAKSIRDYMNSVCTLGEDGKTREWRIWDKDVDTTNVSKLWQDVMKRPRTSTPWIVVSNGSTGYEGPLPKSVDETTALIKKYVKPIARAAPKIEKGK